MLLPGLRQIAQGEVTPYAVQEAQLAGADKGVALTTTAAFTLVPDGTQALELLLRNLAGGGVVGRWTPTPYLIVIKTTDLLVTTANATDYSAAAANATTGDVVLSSLDTLANGDALYVGSHVPFRGLVCTNTATNGTASVLSGTYWDGTTWTNITLTDGTISPAGTTMGQTGNLTWTVPTAWVKAALSVAVSGTAMGIPYRDDPLYWVRLVVSAALDASTTLASIQAMNRSTAYANLLAAPPGREFRCHKGPGGISGIEALTDAGTANLIINCFSRLGADGLGL